MRKSITKRIRVTKNGKVVRRPMGTDHFRTRKETKNIKSKSKNRGLDYPKRKLLS
jgi:ribosomal protein L35